MTQFLTFSYVPRDEWGMPLAYLNDYGGLKVPVIQHIACRESRIERQHSKGENKDIYVLAYLFTTHGIGGYSKSEMLALGIVLLTHSMDKLSLIIHAVCD